MDNRDNLGRFIKGRGENSGHWKGGRYYHQDGYVYIFIPDHPNINKDGCVFEHRLVMERSLGRYLTNKELIHHKNGIKDDNRIENLQIVSRSEHLKLEWKNNKMKNSIKTQFKKGQIPWNKK